MGYMHIDNLYKNTEIMQFKECYALEKIHGTSAYISFKENEGVRFFSGGEKHERFKNLFDEDDLLRRFDIFYSIDITLYGEAYGGKQQGMRETYGEELRFIVFDVKIGDSWLSVDKAKDVADKLCLEFVDYVKIPTELSYIDAQRDLPSVQAKRNGIIEDKIREGVVLRPIEEYTKNNGQRIIVKHKRDEFMETATPRKVDPEKLKVLEEAKEIAAEWVTPMRLNHILDKLDNPTDIRDTSKVIKAMVEDILREAKGEIVISKTVTSAICSAAALMYRNRISNSEDNSKWNK